ncbi:hypothetical protein SERLA73DRAFT_135501 [Serpula lacrymans var. lacrymans S7.3]|uniref:Uncharacterized protein n=1 Tax=Serpula lacrymans var. lacrymans (strain S7.3) TaxID=936435 RepID=F8PWD5_SERL3|nr:hypothetical protein SERLA73DRAFT_135501 [Serpula lacrymans var. lacrymans S7.3]
MNSKKWKPFSTTNENRKHKGLQTETENMSEVSCDLGLECESFTGELGTGGTGSGRKPSTVPPLCELCCSFSL